MINKNFISADSLSAINSYGERFEIGDEVRHDDKGVGEAVISKFELDVPSNEVKAFTEKGWAHIDFITKV